MSIALILVSILVTSVVSVALIAVNDVATRSKYAMFGGGFNETAAKFGRC